MIGLGSDHAGFEYKEKIKALLLAGEDEIKDFGTFSLESADYPDYAHKVASAVSSGEIETGILVCGTGIGMAITANKHEGVRAAVVESVEAAKLTRQHNDANVLCIGSRILTWEKAVEIIIAFLTTEFEGGRHQRRVEKIHTLTNL